MIPEMKKFDEEEIKEEVVEEAEDNALVVQDSQKIALKDYTLDKITTHIDQTRSYQEQIEDFAEAQASVAALQDDGTQDVLMQAKKSEFIDKANVKAKQAQEQVIQAETDIQKAKREKYQLLFDTFGVSDHIPDWLLKILMVIFAPFYVLYVVLIGIPTGFVRFLIDCVDGILVRYDKADNGRKPKIKITVWILLTLIVVAAICLTVLKCTHII